MPTATNSNRPTRRFFGKLASAVGVALLLLAPLSGCANRQQELIESELRKKEAEIDELKAKAGGRDAEVQQLEIELEMLQRCKAKDGKAADGAPSVGSVFFVKKITLGRLTGGVREKAQADGDDALQVLLEPRDADDSPVKAPGAVKIELFEVNAQGLKTPLSEWEIAPRELRKMWDSPLIGGPAYRIVLPWKSYPSTENIKIIVRFTALDGQQFEAEKETTVRLVTPRDRRKAKEPPLTGSFVLPEGMPTPPATAPLPSGPAPELLSQPTLMAPPSRPTPPAQPTSLPAERRPAAPPAAAEEMLPPPLKLPPLDPPLSFEMKPFTPGQQPVLQVEHREEHESLKGQLRPRLAPPQGARPAGD